MIEGNKRLTKEYKINTSGLFSLKYGSMNRLNPKVVYVEGKTWVGPTEEFDYEHEMMKLMSSFEKDLVREAKTYDNFSKKFIFDYDTAAYRMSPGKKKQLIFSFYLTQDKEVKSLKDIKNEISDIAEIACSKFEVNLPKYNFVASKTKKQHIP